MFISHTHRLIFFEVPRTGSHSITEVLERLDPESPTVRARADYSHTDYHAFRIPPEAADYRIIAAHRNPYERLWSHYKHRHQKGNPPIFTVIKWRTYVKWAIDPQSVPHIQMQGAMPEKAVMELPNMHRVTHWLRFEQLTEDWQALTQTLDLDAALLPHRNRSLEPAASEVIYDAELADRVYQRFAVDFEQFAYARDSWRQLQGAVA